MAHLARDVAQAARCFIRDHSAARPDDVIGTLLQLSAGLGNMMLFFKMVAMPGDACSLLFQFVSKAQVQIAQLHGAHSLQDYTFLALLDTIEADKSGVAAETSQLQVLIDPWAHRCALHLQLPHSNGT